MLKHKTPSSFSGLATARAEINPTRALPVIARVWLRHCPPIQPYVRALKHTFIHSPHPFHTDPFTHLIHSPAHPFIHASTNPSTHPSTSSIYPIHPPTHPSIHLPPPSTPSIHPSIYLIHLPHPSIHPSTSSIYPIHPSI